MINERVCGYCPIASCETVVEGNGITEFAQRTVIKCPFNPEFPRNPLDTCSHLQSREKAGYKFDSGTVARLLDLCRTHDVAVQMEYRRPSDAYLLTFIKNGKRIYVTVTPEKLEQSDSPETVIEQYVNAALSSILSGDTEKTKDLRS